MNNHLSCAQEGALAGVKILDLSRLLPGPYCTMMLADLGAEVVKIEEPGRGDYLRHFPPQVNGEGAMFIAVNRNKKSITLNLKKEPGKKIFYQLVEQFDVVVEGFRPGVMDKLELGYDQLAKINPSLVYCSISGYGQDGPYANRAGHDINFLALSGILGFTGSRDGRPAIPGVQIADLNGAMLAAFCIVAALYARQKSGRGQYIDVSMLEGALSWLSMHAGKFFADGENPAPASTDLNGAIPCYNVYRTKDGRYMALGALEPVFWSAFCKTVGREDLIGEQFARGEKGRLVRQELEAIFATKTRDEWVELLREVDCCCEPVNNFEEVFADLQVEYRRAIKTINHPKAGEIRVLDFPARLSQTPAEAKTAPPLLGEHTAAILGQLGYEEKELEELARAGII